MFRYVSNGKEAFLDEKISLGYTVFPRIIAVSRLITSLEKSPPFNGTNNRLPRILAAPQPFLHLLFLFPSRSS